MRNIVIAIHENPIDENNRLYFPNCALHDARLNFEDIGLLGLILNSSNATMSVQEIKNTYTDTDSEIEEAIMNLIDYGYIYTFVDNEGKRNVAVYDELIYKKENSEEMTL